MKKIFRRIACRIALVTAPILASSTVALADNWTNVDELTSKPAPWVGKTLSGIQCADKAQPWGGVGPVDYNRRDEWEKTKQIERAHFFPQVEYLQFGSASTAGSTLIANVDDINFVLMAFPNHHRALNSAINLRFDSRYETEKKAFPPAECYLQRAVNFAPDDGFVYMLYGLLLHRLKMLDQALPLYKKAEELRPDDIQVKYNMGLLLADMKRYEDALPYANLVYAEHFPLQGLRRKLAEHGFEVKSSQTN